MMTTVVDRPRSRRLRAPADATPASGSRRATPARRRVPAEVPPEQNPVVADVMAALAAFDLED